VAFLLPVLYVASFGPACWVNLRTGIGGRAIGGFYRPIAWQYVHGGAIGNAINAWVNLGGDGDSHFYGLGPDGPIWLSDLPIGYWPDGFGNSATEASH